MPQKLHVCRICGKKFATPKGLCGHQRIHSGLQKIWGFKESRVCSVSASEIEKHEVIEAAMNLVMLSQGVYGVAGFEMLSTCSDVVPQALASCLSSKLKKRSQSRNSRYKCKVCGKIFVCSKVLGGHQTVHRSNKGKLARKMEEDGNSLYDSLDAKKIVSQSARFEVSQKNKKKLHSVEPKLDFSKQLSHLGFKKSSSFSESHSPPDAKKIVSEPSSFEVSQEEKILHSVEPKLHFEKSSSFSKTRFSALSSPPETEKIVQEKKNIHFVEPKLDFSKLLSHSGLDKSSSCSKTKISALHSPLRSKTHSTYRFKTCGKSFKCSQSLSGHQTLQRSMKGQSLHNEDGNSLSEASKLVSP